MVVLDTNTILRCILQDDREAALLVNEQMAREKCLILPEVIAEVVYDLLKTYRLDRKAIVQSISVMLGHKNAQVPHKTVIETALRRFDETKLDFVDCLMVGYAVIKGHRIFTFDKELKKYLPQVTQK
jgi:predicted nucleic-acid-binding protein